MKKVIIIGHLDLKNGSTIGAAVKARAIYSELVNKYNKKLIGIVDIYEWRKNRVKVFFSLIFAFFKSKNIVLVISDTSGILMKFLSCLKRINKNNILYLVVGGDIDEILTQHQERINKLKFVDIFFVETKKCVNEMNKLGINNVVLFRNFKYLSPVETYREKCNKPIRLCTFSRVNEEKGISDAIKAVEEINLSMSEERFCLDIYGHIDDEYKKKFCEMISRAKSCNYSGIISPEESIHTINKYDYLLFPTRFDGEGIPGTVIDAFASGIPVIASRWRYYDEMLKDGYNGILYEYKNYRDLINKLMSLNEYSVPYEELCKNSLKSYSKFEADSIMPLLYKYID